MATMLFKEEGMTEAQKDSLAQIGIGACEVCISAKEFVTVGIMIKCCECRASGAVWRYLTSLML
jgi:hypothetical protein